MGFEPKSLRPKSSVQSIMRLWKVPRHFGVYRDEEMRSLSFEVSFTLVFVN